MTQYLTGGGSAGLGAPWLQMIMPPACGEPIAHLHDFRARKASRRPPEAMISRVVKGSTGQRLDLA
eukprot:CAMPEP_0115833908 /NCGR_PEP_ID=MMETSP0287-20121206/3412_1 /TAXON_ID=412157 /ORGANISM="Chrysochromulina rotalis, Strain UIO044" /LENGTH=65 /DNA_ID=CAMNT_0003287331 /DNA_START=291 /DNA_END=488 /DNA_ORIENTATION=-